MNQHIKDYAKFIGSYLLVTLVLLMGVRFYVGGNGLYIHFQPYIFVFLTTGFVIMVAILLKNRNKFKSEVLYRIHLISLMAIFLPTLIYQLIFDDFITVQIADNHYIPILKLYFYYFNFIVQAYIFGTLILLVNSLTIRNRITIIYSIVSLGCLFGYFYLTI